LETSLLLLAEDEALIRELLGDVLAAAGFKVVAASNGTLAVAELDADATRFRAVITDIRLGSKLDGWDVARRARELVPHMPVVYMTGNSGPDWASRGVPNSVLVAKPFMPVQIITVVSMLLNAADAYRRNPSLDLP
jgi:DNA-binding response OmpR family regulator